MSDISIVLSGEAGQGIQTIEHVLTRIFKFSGYHVFATEEYMSRVRGGVNTTTIRVAAHPVTTVIDHIDVLMVLGQGSINHLQQRISEQTIVLGEADNLSSNEQAAITHFKDIPLRQLAKEVGKTIYANSVAVGVICGLFNIDTDTLEKYLEQHFAAKGDEIIASNIEAALQGYQLGEDLPSEFQCKPKPEPQEDIKDDILINGTEAVALGAINGGANFLSFYPMSPATGVATFFAQHADEFELVVEQVEDEIAALNMALGAWYAGARALVTTSGGGFALMVEALSLSGIIESPAVIHLAQRPGPATGLPTRTEQGDLLFSLTAGHGEFPRILLAPGDLVEGYELSRQAFALADKYQVPVILLTDQYYLDSYYNISELPFSKDIPALEIIETNENYQRYADQKNGVSPRGIPGYGNGLVAVDSDEHDPAGHITEDFETRTKMVDKRLRKLETLKTAIIPPELKGPQDYEILIIGWGSTKNVIREAINELDLDETAHLHFKQVYPLHPDTAQYLSRAKQTIVVENNATAQFRQLMRITTGIDGGHSILKYNGLAFTTEEIKKQLKQHLKEA